VANELEVNPDADVSHGSPLSMYNLDDGQYYAQEGARAQEAVITIKNIPELVTNGLTLRDRICAKSHPP
jgi:hypothetical protein